MSEELLPGEVFGNYEIQGELGRGGMGHVYRARHVTLDREVAVKLLATQYSHSEAFIQRFLKEARAAARLNHPNIVQIYDFGQVDSLYYLAMELLDGRSLGYYLRHSGRFSEADAIAITRQACIALGVAHAAGIVHRDVKPDNFILTSQGIVKLVDLGLAKRLDDDHHLTQTGVSAGTPDYISPEQINGRKDIDGRADIYSLGATLYHLVSGQPPFPAPSPMAIIARHLRDDLPDPRTIVPELSAGLVGVIHKAMAREREDRYQDTHAFNVDLYLVQTGQGIAPPTMTASWTPATPVAAPTMASGGETPLPWEPELLRRVEENLAPMVGPLARVLVRNTARTTTDLRELCTALTEHIPQEAERRRFMVAVLDGQNSSPGSQPQAASRFGSQYPASQGSLAGSGMGSMAVTWDESALKTAEQRLAEVIGPLARVLVKKAAKRAHSWGDLVSDLAVNLPTEAQRQSFLDAVRGLAP